MKQVFGTDNHCVQDDGCGHEILFVPFQGVVTAIGAVVTAVTGIKIF